VAPCSIHSCAPPEGEDVEATEDHQQICGEVDEDEVQVDVLRSQHHRHGPLAVFVLAVCPSDASFLSSPQIELCRGEQETLLASLLSTHQTSLSALETCFDFSVFSPPDPLPSSPRLAICLWELGFVLSTKDFDLASSSHLGFDPATFSSSAGSPPSSSRPSAASLLAPETQPCCALDFSSCPHAPASSRLLRLRLQV